MGLIRLIIFGLVVYLVYLLVKRWRQQQAERNLPTRTGEQNRNDNMVRCHQCGLFVPTEEAIRDGERFYCSEAHRLTDRRDS